MSETVNWYKLFSDDVLEFGFGADPTEWTRGRQDIKGAGLLTGGGMLFELLMGAGEYWQADKRVAPVVSGAEAAPTIIASCIAWHIPAGVEGYLWEDYRDIAGTPWFQCLLKKKPQKEKLSEPYIKSISEYSGSWLRLLLGDLDQESFYHDIAVVPSLEGIFE